MPTLQLQNHRFRYSSSLSRVVTLAATLGLVLLIVYAPSWQHVILTLALAGSALGFAIVLIEKSRVRYTLTDSHFQQHLAKGGWVVKWNNIERIGLCTHEKDGWHQPLPWIGIKLKRYEPVLEAICPRIISDMLLGQRALLYLGAQQSSMVARFEDLVLDTSPVKKSNGGYYTGLVAMLANRMRHQRQFHDFDLFISAQDLDRDAEDFIGLTRRYLAAAEPSIKSEDS
ncbi:DUF2982 domain-containing protein [Vibrio sp. SM6]|uniref:DUF2982 domain-containing protein n=1 Tax=Vibrio agarilyticus TaxID=2726741 RepID=A0A7X8TSJ3_9VIBR|nr:DUF2982 domain-containing protein [Vibrio agarilyticus]NLS14046.1 DUF2982 domain-containing protein [Vibrio agarilyticus]